MQHRKEGQVSVSEGPVNNAGSDAACCQTLSTRRRPAAVVSSIGIGGGEAKEEGSYSVSNAALTYTAAYSRTASPPRKLY